MIIFSSTFKCALCKFTVLGYKIRNEKFNLNLLNCAISIFNFFAFDLF